MFGRTSKKQQTQTTRRRPGAGNTTGSFATYYASKRSNVSAMSRENESRNTQKNSKRPSWLRQVVAPASVDSLLQRFGKIVLAVILIACVISLLQIDTKPRIVILNSSASSYALHTKAEYEAVVTNKLRSSFLDSNKITVNTRGIVTALRQKFPEIYDASVVLPLVGHRPTVFVELAQPKLVLRTASMTAILDEAGRALSVSATTETVSSALPLLSDESSLKASVGQIALPSSTVRFVLDVVRQFKAQDTRISKLILPAGTEELDVYPAGVKYHVKFNVHETTSRQQAGTYFAVRQELEQRQGSKAPKQYVDVRLTGRAYMQ